MAQWHSVDLTNFDIAPTAQAARSASEVVAKRAVGLAREATYLGVGLGLLTFQRAQVRRRELERSLRN